jgi:hypothetical protein
MMSTTSMADVERGAADGTGCHLVSEHHASGLGRAVALEGDEAETDVKDDKLPVTSHAAATLGHPIPVEIPHPQDKVSRFWSGTRQDAAVDCRSGGISTCEGDSGETVQDVSQEASGGVSVVTGWGVGSTLISIFSASKSAASESGCNERMVAPGEGRACYEHPGHAMCDELQRMMEAKSARLGSDGLLGTVVPTWLEPRASAESGVVQEDATATSDTEAQVEDGRAHSRVDDVLFSATGDPKMPADAKEHEVGVSRNSMRADTRGLSKVAAAKHRLETKVKQETQSFAKMPTKPPISVSSHSSKVHEQRRKHELAKQRMPVTAPR